jgi:hypothetical protein
MDSSMMNTNSLSDSTEEENALVMISLTTNIKLTRAAFYTLFAGLILSIVIAFTLPVYGPLIGIVVLFVWMLVAYNLNCVQVGHCNNWAWILTVFYLVYIGFAIFALIYHNDKIAAKFGKSLNTVKKSRK